MAGERASLDELARRHGTDKGGHRHGFAATYEGFLHPLRDTHVTLLELGVYEGASLRMWRDFFPAGEIFGVDVKKSALAHAGDRIQVFEGDQKDPEVLARVVAASGPLDVVIDDGSHRYAEQTGSLLALWPHLKVGGTYAMEDVHTSYQAKYGMGFDAPRTTIKFLKRVVDDLHAHLHDEEEILPGLTSVHFHYGTVILRKERAKPLKRSPVRST